MKNRQTLWLLIIALVALPTSASAETAPVFLLKWGSFGSGPGQFKGPTDVKVDPTGNVYVADPANVRVQKFDGNGAFLAQLVSAPSGPAAFGQTPSCAVGSDGKIYVAGQSGDVCVFAPDFAFIARWSVPNATYLELDPVGSYLYATVSQDSIVRLSPLTGARLASWSRIRPGIVCGFGVGPDDAAYLGATDYVDIYDMNGLFSASVGGPGTAAGEFSAVRGVSCDAAGNFYVGDGGNARVQKFAHDRSFLSMWGSFGTGNGQFGHNIFAIAVDSGGSVFVDDLDNNRIQKFGQPSTPTRHATWGRLKSNYR